MIERIEEVRARVDRKPGSPTIDAALTATTTPVVQITENGLGMRGQHAVTTAPTSASQ